MQVLQGELYHYTKLALWVDPYFHIFSAIQLIIYDYIRETH
jgi:hypothetical protein